MTFDTAQTYFHSGTEVGLLNSELAVLPGILVVTPENSVDFQRRTWCHRRPVSLITNNKYYGAYLTDTFDVTHALSVTASARYNIAKIDLEDQLGTNLNGNNRFTHFDPAHGCNL